jgi:hypothetical protein
MTSDQIWTKRNYEMLSVGATWGIPRSGLVFQKTEKGFKLISVMPYMAEMSDGFRNGMDVPASPTALRKHQVADFRLLKIKHEEVGLEISDPESLLEKDVNE